VPTHRLPHNAGIASEDTEEALSPCPRRPICRSAFRPALSSAGLSVDALSALLPLLRFALWTWNLYTPGMSVCQELFSMDKRIFAYHTVCSRERPVCRSGAHGRSQRM